MGPQTSEQERLLRQAAIALLAVPILVAVYAGALLRRSTLARFGLALGLTLTLGIGVIGAAQPATTVARPLVAIVPLTQAAFSTTFSTNRGLTDPVQIEFSTAMEPASVAAAITVQPATPIVLSWDPTATVLTVGPRDRWAPATFHTITVLAGALAQSGQPLVRPVRAAFLTRDATTASVTATEPVGDRVATTTDFVVAFGRAIDRETVLTSIRLDPLTPGTVTSTPTGDGHLARYTFAPSAPLKPDVAYRLIVAGIKDTDGVPLDTVILAVTTTKAPAVVRFRPRAGTTDVPRDAAISVRFTQAMDRRTTARAFSVSVGGTAIAGVVAWAERDTVLIFTPTAQLPFASTVVMDVTGDATSASGTRLAAVAHGTFQTIKKPAPAKTPAKTPAKPKASSGGSSAGSSSGGGAVGGGSWGAVETYYLRLMNCTRTGGWVTSTGTCSSPGGRNVAPLKLDSGISSKVSRPYAKRIAISGDCSHFIGGTPGDRLRRAGYTSYRWAENLGCRSGNPYAAVLGSHLFFQSEKSYGGGHYVNLMNAAYNRVGIGVWVSGGRVRLVIDFYHS
jgi:uncharacterized protein YkwD